MCVYLLKLENALRGTYLSPNITLSVDASYAVVHRNNASSKLPEETTINYDTMQTTARALQC